LRILGHTSGAAEHSEKPEAVYEILETYFPVSSKIELFARKTRKGWAAAGNEIEGGSWIWRNAPRASNPPRGRTDDATPRLLVVRPPWPSSSGGPPAPTRALWPTPTSNPSYFSLESAGRSRRAWSQILRVTSARHSTSPDCRGRGSVCVASAINEVTQRARGVATPHRPLASGLATMEITDAASKM